MTLVSIAVLSTAAAPSSSPARQSVTAGKGSSEMGLAADCRMVMVGPDRHRDRVSEKTRAVVLKPPKITRSWENIFFPIPLHFSFFQRVRNKLPKTTS